IWNAPPVRTVMITVLPEDATMTCTADRGKPAGSLVAVSVKVADAADGSAADLTKMSVTFRIHGLTTGLFLDPTVRADASGIATYTYPRGLDPDVYEVVVLPQANQYFSPLSPMTVDVGVYDRNVSETGTGRVSDGGNKSDFSLNAKYGAGDQLQG